MQDLQKAGKYKILSRIGEGGFGVVYKGRDPFIKRTVAIKTCTSESEGTRRRFLREAEIAGNIVHPNITLVYDFGFEGEVPYLVQEFLTGEDLDQKILRRDEIPLTVKLDYLLQAAQGLGFAHEHGITHRDVKPSNLRVLEDGRVKIMDFGIAKLASGETQLTQTGTTLGTPAYLSPEQLRGDEVDGRSDIYSFGALAYELLIYRRMFDAQTISALFFQILHQAPNPLSSGLDDCPKELNELMVRCVAKEPADRYQSFVEIIQDLRKVIDLLPAQASEATVPPSPSPPPSTDLEDKAGAERDRQSVIAKTRNEIEELLATGSQESAAAALSQARERFGDLVPFRTLHERLVQLRAANEVEAVEESAELLAAVGEVRQLTQVGRLAEADQALSAARAEFPEGPSLIAAGRQLRVRTKIVEAQTALDEGQIARAMEAAERAQELDPEAPRLHPLLRAIDEQRRVERIPEVPPVIPPEVPVKPQRAEPEIEAQVEPRPQPQPPTPPPRPRPKPDPTSITEAPTGEIPIPKIPDRESPPPEEITEPAPPEEAPPAPTRPVSTATPQLAAVPVSDSPDLPYYLRQSLSEENQGRRRLLLGWLAAVAAATLLFTIVFWVRRSTPATIETGTLLLDATPWAEVISVTSPGGEEMLGTLTGDDKLFTPVSIELPPGKYRVVLKGPGSADPRTLDVELAGSVQTRHRVELERVTAEEYMEAIGLAPRGPP